MTFKFKKIWAIVFGLLSCKSKPAQYPVNNQIVRTGNEYPVNFDTLYQKTFDEVVRILKPYEYNTNSHLQRRVYDTYYRIGLSSKSIIDHKNMIKSLLNACGDSLKTSYACHQSLEYLQTVDKNEFDTDDIEKIQNLLTKDYTAYYPHPLEYMPYDDLVLLVGYLDIEKSVPKLKSLVAPESKYERKWEAHLALARLGEKESIDYCIETGKKSGYDLNKLKEIAYIRQPEMIALFDYYLFDDNLVTLSKNEELATLNYILNLYCKSLKDFPLNSNNFYDTKERLMIARQWIKEHKGKYAMNRNTF